MPLKVRRSRAEEDHSLIAFEIKGPGCGRVQLENLLLQGMEHRNWLERNKMSNKLMLEGPKGKNINTRKRVRLVLGYCDDTIPELFQEIPARELSKDRYLGIDFCRLVPAPDSVEKVQVKTFTEN